MSTVAEIKTAIDHFPSRERDELEALLWQDEETPPPGVREKLAEALAGQFVPGDRANIDRILASLECPRDGRRASLSSATCRGLPATPASKTSVCHQSFLA